MQEFCPFYRIYLFKQLSDFGYETLESHTLIDSTIGRGRIVARRLPDARPTLPEFDLVIKWPILDDLIKGHQLAIGKGRYHKRETQTGRHNSK